MLNASAMACARRATRLAIALPGRRETVGGDRARQGDVRCEQVEIAAQAVEQAFTAFRVAFDAHLAPGGRVQVFDVGHQAFVRRAETQGVDTFTDQLVAGIGMTGQRVVPDVDEPDRQPSCAMSA